ncbi:hypothetical protein [uncultured Microbacterium sp.]|nr:hypothetical protein [uncultured Microbacterium sp.]
MRSVRNASSPPRGAQNRTVIESDSQPSAAFDDQDAAVILGYN